MRIADKTCPNEKEMAHFSENMKRRRIELGLSYQSLGERTGISKSTLQRYETGFIKNIPFSKLKALARGLETTVEKLLDWQDYGKDLDDTKSAFYDILSYLGYEIETTAMPLSLQDYYEQNGIELIDDGKPDMVWVRYTKNNKCYNVTWEQLNTLDAEISNFAEFIMHKLISQSEEIKRPDDWYKVKPDDD